MSNLRPSAALREVVVGVGLVVLSVVLTWPLARLLPIAVAYPGDPLTNAYIVSWNVHALINAGTAIYDANIFFPARSVLALSENLFGLLPLALPLSLVLEPLTVHNILLILGFAFSGYGAYVLGRTVTGSTTAGLVAGLLYGFCPWRFTHIAHLQHAWGGWLPLIIAAIIRFERKRDVKGAVLIAVAVVMNGLTNLHYLVFGGAAAVLTVAVLLASSTVRMQRRHLVAIGAALILPVLLLAGILWPYQSALKIHGLRGNAAETDLYSASTEDWLQPEVSREPERHVFPGYVALIAGAVGLFEWRRQTDRRLMYASLLLIAAGVLLSLGRATAVYAYAFDHLSVISGIRAPARWAVLAYVGLAILAALGVNKRRTAGAVICVAAVVQVWDVPMRWYLMPRDVAPVYRWLASTPRDGAILELPIGERDFYYLQGAAVHHRPIFNGVPGPVPAGYVELVRTFSAASIPDSALTALKQAGGSTIVVHSDALGENRNEVLRWLRAALARGDLRYGGHFDAGLTGDFVFHTSRLETKADEALLSFLHGDGTITGRDLPFGFLEAPATNADASGRLKVRGWALSGSGIRTVRLWFANKACSAAAELEPYPALQKVVPGYSTETARFTLSLAKRPCGKEENDLLVELVDHRGRSVTLPHVWFKWRNQ